MAKNNGTGILTLFTQITRRLSTVSAHAFSFAVIFAVVTTFIILGPLLSEGDDWLQWLQTFADVVQVLMLFLLQNSQQRDFDTLHLKLDELLSRHPDANKRLLDAEDLSEEEVEAIRKRYQQMAGVKPD